MYITWNTDYPFFLVLFWNFHYFGKVFCKFNGIITKFFYFFSVPVKIKLFFPSEALLLDGLHIHCHWIPLTFFLLHEVGASIRTWIFSLCVIVVKSFVCMRLTSSSISAFFCKSSNFEESFYGENSLSDFTNLFFKV